jgi:hypothetical protein
MVDRWIVIAFVAVFLLGLAAAGWHFRQFTPIYQKPCTTADAHCGEKRI